jgi:chemotaxis protein CheD
MEEQILQHYLYPATLHASSEPTKIMTVLGSCVSLCLWDPILRIGGMNHFMLPLWNGEGLASPKYGNIANEKLLEKMLYLGSKQVNLRAKIFGGGEVIESTIQQFKIGERNADHILEFVEDYRIQVVAKSLGGKLGRKIIFNSETGEVMHKFIEKTIYPT